MFDKLDLSNLDIGSLMTDVQKKAQELKQEASGKSYTAKSGGGLISATLNGNLELLDLSIDDSLLEDKESMQILIISAVNEAIKMAEDDKKNSALGMLGDFNPFGAKQQ
jgi:DNA-binding YbaB/EbfC family protein